MSPATAALRLYRHVLADRLCLDEVTEHREPDRVTFTHRGIRAHIRISYPNLAFCWIGAGFTRPDLPDHVLLQVCHDVTDRNVIAKATLAADGIHLSVETYTGPAGTLPTPDALTASLPALLTCLHTAAADLLERLTLAHLEQDLQDLTQPDSTPPHPSARTTEG